MALSFYLNLMRPTRMAASAAIDGGQGAVERPLFGIVFHRYATSYLHSAIRVGDFEPGLND